MGFNLRNLDCVNCDDGHDLFETDKSTIVCLRCGVERKIVANCTYNNCGFATRHSPFLSGYSRSKRFRSMVTTLFWPTPVNADHKMLKYMLMRRFNNRTEIIKAITTSPLKDKRFGSIHIFCRLLDPEYEEPKHDCLFRMLQKMVWDFEVIEGRFRQRFTKEPFINYTFLIRFLLKKLGYEVYLQFVKQLKCEKRKTRYNEMLVELADGSALLGRH